jgi:GTP1/Obg family GTP-binding protein|tara:strand:- start:15 stop:251 length:237 start_codon:yes stop_codon:yes gene_type:complete
MEEIKKLEAHLLNRKKQHEIGNQIVKRRINQVLLDRSEEQINEITKNYDMGFLTLFEMINQKIDSLRQVQDNMYNTQL